jgi:hypothetical protein
MSALHIPGELTPDELAQALVTASLAISGWKSNRVRGALNAAAGDDRTGQTDHDQALRVLLRHLGTPASVLSAGQPTPGELVDRWQDQDGRSYEEMARTLADAAARLRAEAAAGPEREIFVPGDLDHLQLITALFTAAVKVSDRSTNRLRAAVNLGANSDQDERRDHDQALRVLLRHLDVADTDAAVGDLVDRWQDQHKPTYDRAVQLLTAAGTALRAETKRAAR